MNNVPLPIYQKVTNKGEFILFNYFLSVDLFMAMSTTLPSMVPKNIIKLYLVNNNLTDESHQDLYQGLKNTYGLQTLLIAKNTIGNCTLDKLVDFIQSPGFEEMKKFVIKDPIVTKIDLQTIPMAIMNSSDSLIELKKLTLSNIQLGAEGLGYLGIAIKGLKNLHHLDVSNNVLNSKCLSMLFQQIMLNNKLKSLNISYNNLSEPYSFVD